MYARSTQNTCSSDSLWPQRPFTSAPRVSEISACSVISWEHRCPAPPQRTGPWGGCKRRRVQTPGCTPERSFARARAPRSGNMRLGAVRADPAVREAERGVTFKAGRASRRRDKPEPPCSIQEQPAGAQGARRATQVFIGPRGWVPFAPGALGASWEGKGSLHQHNCWPTHHKGQ